MKLQGAAVQGGLAALGLVLAYTTWQREPEKAPGQTVLWDLGKKDVEKVRFEDDKGWVELYRKPGTADEGAWLHVSARADTKAPERELRANESAEKVLEAFAPLRVSRALGNVEDAKLREFGLLAPAPSDAGALPAGSRPVRKLVVTARGESRAFAIGTSTFTYASYLKDERDARVYLPGGALVSDLESLGTRVDRRLHTFKAGDWDALTVSAGGKQRELVVVGAETNPAAAKLASKKTPDKADEQAKNWHDKVWSPFPVEVLGHGEKPANGEPQAVLKVEYRSRGAAKGFVEFGRVQGVAPTPPPAGTSAPPPAAPPPVEVYARSEHTAGWVKLSASADDLLKEAEKIAGTE